MSTVFAINIKVCTLVSTVLFLHNTFLAYARAHSLETFTQNIIENAVYCISRMKFYTVQIRTISTYSCYRIKRTMLLWNISM